MTQQIVTRCEAAFERKKSWDPLFEDIYEYILPYRKSVDGDSGRNKVSHLFDSTAVQGAFRFAGRFQAEVTPTNEVWFEICAGPLYPEEKKDELKRFLEHDNKIMQVALNTGEFHTASMEMYQDLCAGTGVLFVLEPDDDDELINYVSAPFSEVAIDCNAKGHVSGIHWKKKYTASEVYMGWPDLRGKMPKEIKEAHTANSKSKDVEVIQSIVHDPKEKDRDKRWCYYLILKKGLHTLTTSHSRYSPAIVPRYFRLPGEDIGRGPAMIVLPNVRTANKQVELILQAAALALFGMFTATDDGILNPDKFKVEPGAIVYVESNGSSAYGGRSLEKLDMASNVNMSELVLQDQRSLIKAGLMDDQLPPEVGAVRSPTEIVARQRNQSFDISVAYGRIQSEYILKLIQRVHEILDKSDLVTPNITIDQKMIMVKSVGPMTKAQNMSRIEGMVQSLEIALSIGGQELTAMVYQVEDIILEIGELMGMPASKVRSKIDRDQLMEMVAGMISQSQQKADASGGAGPIDAAMGASG